MAQLGNLNPNDRIFNNRWISPDVFGSRQSKLATIIRHPHNIPVIERCVINMHTISVHTLKFLKQLYLHRFNLNMANNINERITESIQLNKELIINIGQGRLNQATKDLRLMLRNFYDNNYIHTLHPGEPRPPCTHLHTPIDYFANQVLTMYEIMLNNIFTSMLRNMLIVIVIKLMCSTILIITIT